MAFPHISEVPEAVDLAIVAVPAPSVVDTVEACAARGVRVAVIYSAGFAEMGAEGRRHQRRLTEIAAETGLRIVGPNCLGVYNSELGFFATFSTTLEDGFPAPGGVALVSQSGAYGSHLSLLARKRNIDIRYWVTTGNEADVSVPEVLGWLAEQDDVSVIMAHAEGITDRDALVRALGTARARRKPVVFQKVGVTDVGAQAVQSHTASLAGADPVYEAAFRQFGAYRARDTDEMLDVAYAASFGVFPESPRVALVSISGGVGVQMADAAVGFGLDVAPLSESAQQRLKAALPYASPRNPVDITAQAFNRIDLISDNLGIVFEEERHDAVVAFFTYVAAADGMVEPIRDAIHAARERRPGCALVLSIVAPPDVVRQYEAVGCPVFEDPTRAVRSPSRRSTGSAGSSRRCTDGLLRNARDGSVGRHDHRAAHTGPARGPHLGTGGETPPLRGGSAGGRRGVRAHRRRDRARRRRIRRPVAVKLCAPGRPAQDRARRRGARRVDGGGGAPGLRDGHVARPRGGPGDPHRGCAGRADGHRRRRDDPRRPPRPDVRAGRHVRSRRDARGGDRGRQLPRGAVRRGRGAADDCGDTRRQDTPRNARQGSVRHGPPWRRPCHACRSSRRSTAAGSTAPRSTRSSCSRKVTAPLLSTP